jgi:hypothetical protein
MLAEVSAPDVNKHWFAGTGRASQWKRPLSASSSHWWARPARRSRRSPILGIGEGHVFGWLQLTGVVLGAAVTLLGLALAMEWVP